MDRPVALIATPADKAQAYLSAAGVRLTSKPDHDGAGPVSAAEVGNHFLVWCNLEAIPAYSGVDFNLLSMTCPILVLERSDDTDATSVRFYQDGTERWRVAFGEDPASGVVAFGKIPVSLERLRSDTRSMSADDDVDASGRESAIPATVFREITDFDFRNGPPAGLMRLSGELPRLGLPIGNDRKPWWRLW